MLVAQNQAIQVAFTVADNGGSPISAIEYRLNGGGWIDAGTLSSPFTIGSADQRHLLHRRGARPTTRSASAPASTPASATPLTVPGRADGRRRGVRHRIAPTCRGPRPATTAARPSRPTSRAAYATPSVARSRWRPCTTASTSCSITGLTNGTTYYVSVIAQNAAGIGRRHRHRASPVTPLARPGAPTLNSLTAGDAFLTLDFTAGTAGSSSITGYQYQLNGGAWLPASSTTSPLTISGLTNGTSYTVALRAVSAAGVGVASTTLTAHAVHASRTHPTRRRPSRQRRRR